MVGIKCSTCLEPEQTTYFSVGFGVVGFRNNGPISPFQGRQVPSAGVNLPCLFAGLIYLLNDLDKSFVSGCSASNLSPGCWLPELCDIILAHCLEGGTEDKQRGVSQVNNSD